MWVIYTNLACHRRYISCAKKYSSCDTRCSLFFLWQETFILSQENSFCDRYHTPFIISCILPVTGSFSCDMDIFHVTRIVLLLQGVLYASHEVYFRKWFFILFCHKKYFSCETKKLFFPVTQNVLPVTGFGPHLAIDIHPICTNSISCHKNYFSCNRE